MSSYFRSFYALVFALAFVLYGHESLDRFMIHFSHASAIFRHHYISVPSASRTCPPTCFLSLFPISSHYHVILHISCDLFCCASCLTVLFITTLAIPISYLIIIAFSLSSSLQTRDPIADHQIFFSVCSFRMKNPTACMHPLPPWS